MNKVKFFPAIDEKLEEHVNDWLEKHRDIQIHKMYMTASNHANLAKFWIWYSTYKKSKRRLSDTSGLGPYKR